MRENLSIRMMKCLQRGAQSLSSEARERIAQFVGSKQMAGSAAFVDRGGQADVYYTFFGWMLSYALHISLDAKQRSAYLNQARNDSGDLVHDAAYRGCEGIDRLMRWGQWAQWGRWGRRDNAKPGYRQMPQDDAWSPYSQFVRLLLSESLGERVSNGDELLRELEAYHTTDGGYSNERSNAMAPTLNATAAALAVKGRLTGWKICEDVAVLQGMQNETGGFLAVAYAPMADLLSTATALFVLRCYGVKPRFDATDFIDAHWLPDGGFAATLMDDVGDVEYTFYGLLALGAIKSEE